ncbi:DNA-binding MarR family transcriptional regulator [Kineococcus xinjiangensis]|uniref:DNA-binding MarR family transcriptional regulator n=1 Tax=Kineococcus xinjiangensis TaxID=512762 RepID=A0A2S6IE35_9ACTN|nr:MarR family transcriptional regulator [Kineococcus xinjiangensis]PPK92484.1 DNA-binding MarR family transcriptional regulator [Kineococcus xinjiangensis]
MPAVRLLDLLTRAQRLAWRELAERFAEEGTGVEQWRVLRALAGTDGTTMGHLAEQLQVPPASLTRLVDGLVDDALVYRRPSTTDRRRIVAHLSDRGAALLERLEAIAAAHEAALTAGPRPELAQLHTALGPAVAACARDR